MGQPHVQDRVLQQPQPEAGEQRPRRHQLRDRQLHAGHRRGQPVRHVGFGFSNAAIGSFSSFVQASAYVEGTFNYDNREAYVQDNWKVKPKWTIDYGVRFVHAIPQHDALLQSGNFLPDKWVQSAAPALYVPGCVGNTRDVHGLEPFGEEPADRRSSSARTPRWPSARSCRTPAPSRNGLFQSGKEIADTTYLFPKLNVGPRFGTAYDVSGTSTSSCADRSASTSTGRAAATRRRSWATRSCPACRPCGTRSCRAWAGLADAVARAAHGLPVQQQAADLDGMEHRRPDADSLGHVR